MSDRAATPLVSVVVPCRNERDHIGGCIDSILANDYPRDRLEIIIVDGESDDGTREILAARSCAVPALRWLPNPARTTPAALNIGIRASSGSVIVRMDVHCRYPAHYIRTLVGWLERSGADNVGGACRTLPANDTPTARAIAVALSHPLGVGNALFRVGVSEPRWVDTVPFGCYRREVFERIGLFDEELVRNQDDELNHRLIGHGGRILIVPDVTSDYFARASLGKLALMYYQYGYFKPLVARKLGRVATLRQLAPPALVLSLALGLLAAPFSRVAATVLMGAVALYLAVILAASLRVALRSGVSLLAPLVAAFPIMHFAYGAGFLRGALDLARRSHAARRADAPIPVSR
ncbi:MAG TPA: glycosyltransferase family 2 protein [Gemmatimonadaceae bacterium]